MAAGKPPIKFSPEGIGRLTGVRLTVYRGRSGTPDAISNNEASYHAYKERKYGLLAHLGERLICTQEAPGAKPGESTKFWTSS